MEKLIEIDSINLKQILSICETAANKSLKAVLNGVCFRRTDDNKLKIVSTDAAILSETTIEDIVFNDIFYEVVLDSKTLSTILKKYKKQCLIHLALYLDNKDYIIEINGEKNYIDSIKYDYPRTDGLVPQYTNTYEITLSVNVLEKLVKSMKASEDKTVRLKFNTDSNLKAFTGSTKSIKLLMTPCRADF